MYTPIDKKILKLSNGQLVDAELLEKEIKKICHYVHHVVLALKDEQHLVAIIFPNRALFSNPDYEKSPEEGCFCPRNLKELGKCLSGCKHTINLKLLPGYAKINSAIIINTDLSKEDGTLTSSANAISGNVIMKYKNLLDNLFIGKETTKEEVVYIKLNT